MKRLTALLLAAVMMLSAVGCKESGGSHGGPGGTETNGPETETGTGQTETDPPQTEPPETQTEYKEPELAVSKTKGMELAERTFTFDDGMYFTMTMPRDWEISIGGYGSGYIIYIYDPKDPTLQVYYSICGNGMLKSQYAYDWYNSVYPYSIFSGMIVNESATVEEFFKDYKDLTDAYAVWEPNYAGTTFPWMKDFSVIESWELDDMYYDIALDDKMFHATFTDGITGDAGEGMFCAAITEGEVISYPDFDGGNYFYFNCAFVTAPYGMLQEYYPLLTEILGSIEFTPSFLKKASQNQLKGSIDASLYNRLIEDTAQVMADDFEAGQEIYKIQANEYADRRDGFERYLDTETNMVLRVEKGVMDGYDGERYIRVEEGSEAYGWPVEGYVYY